MRYFYIRTQVLENYGTGRFKDGEAYWKFKGGEDYIISGVDRVQDAVAFVAALVTANGLSWKEFPVSWEEVGEDFVTEFERDQQEFDGGIQFPAKRINLAWRYNTRGEVEHFAA